MILIVPLPRIPFSSLGRIQLMTMLPMHRWNMTGTSINNEKVFIDTSYLLALELARDQNHEAATQHWQSIVPSPPSFVTTSYVSDEVVKYFNSRGHHAKAVQVGNNLLASTSVEMVHVD